MGRSTGRSVGGSTRRRQSAAAFRRPPVLGRPKTRRLRSLPPVAAASCLPCVFAGGGASLAAGRPPWVRGVASPLPRNSGSIFAPRRLPPTEGKSAEFLCELRSPQRMRKRQKLRSSLSPSPRSWRASRHTPPSLSSGLRTAEYRWRGVPGEEERDPLTAGTLAGVPAMPAHSAGRLGESSCSAALRPTKPAGPCRRRGLRPRSAYGVPSPTRGSAAGDRRSGSSDGQKHGRHQLTPRRPPATPPRKERPSLQQRPSRARYTRSTWQARDGRRRLSLSPRLLSHRPGCELTAVRQARDGRRSGAFANASHSLSPRRRKPTASPR
jgi:hypothetical protein